MKFLPKRIALVALCPSLCAARVAAAEAEATALFEKEIRPLLERQCFQCHSHKADKIKGGLVLDIREAILKGGDTGPAVVPGRPEKSLLLLAVKKDRKSTRLNSSH